MQFYDTDVRAYKASKQVLVLGYKLIEAFYGNAQVKDMEQGTEEVVAIADLPSRVAKLVQGLGIRSLVATKRQAPAAETTAASSFPQKEAGNSKASARPSQHDGPSHSLPA